MPSHTLLVCSWGKEGAAILSQPTREYFQSSPFVPDSKEEPEVNPLASVRSSSAAFSGWSGDPEQLLELDQSGDSEEFWNEERRRKWAQGVASPNASTEKPEEDDGLDELAADDAFIGGE